VTQPWGGQQGQGGGPQGQWPGQQPWPGQQQGNHQQAPWTTPPGQNPYAQGPGQPYQQPGYQQPGYQQPGYQQVRYPVQPQGYGQPGFVPPPRRRSPLLGLLGGLAFVMIAGFFVIALFNYLSPVTPDRPPVPSTEPTYGQDVKVPAPDPDPPALPSPETYDEATTWMKSNAIYSQSVPVPTACKLDRIDVSTASKGSLESHLNELTACLWTVWNPPITAAHFELPRPTVTVYGKSVTTACGQSESHNAFYCSADQQIYYAQNVYEIMPKALRNKPFVAETVLAHEFGHAIQARTGILISESAWQQKSSESKAAEFSRRTETQADCMGGLFMHAVQNASGMTQTDLANIRQLSGAIGDDVLSGDPTIVGDHGLSKSRLYWFGQGLGNASVGICNTYVAASDKVR
jgi:predicted metalloprotease